MAPDSMLQAAAQARFLPKGGPARSQPRQLGLSAGRKLRPEPGLRNLTIAMLNPSDAGYSITRTSTV